MNQIMENIRWQNTIKNKIILKFSLIVLTLF